ncbi:hypothetical protein DACRYDRAFT_112726 [Dacryopinax primogenitus]|uniref:Uncharacterized protein n=1 Tax=Dacryopinax primogenitus (strain DJM 731) TaxID=1858805 RepID=M5FNN7_DACPD|nr:uncharacterized protein DACRYDRAFT_112726 [Dacryopinax primogenitus]EJT96478.1 hypothetical protein DACRYDRAFT_112726 [Dacryopinax primogenitus]
MGVNRLKLRLCTCILGAGSEGLRGRVPIRCALYPDNTQPPAVASFCTDTSSTVCHEDDIYPVFGTTPSANGAQNALTREVQQRYAQWLLNGVPGGDWRGVQGNDVSARILGGPQDAGVVAAGACDPAFWGQSVNFDYQVFTS